MQFAKKKKDLGFHSRLVALVDRCRRHRHTLLDVKGLPLATEEGKSVKRDLILAKKDLLSLTYLSEAASLRKSREKPVPARFQ